MLFFLKFFAKNHRFARAWLRMFMKLSSAANAYRSPLADLTK